MHVNTLDAHLENDAAEQMQNGIADTGGACGRCSAAPDDNGRKQCHQLPEQKQGNQVSSKTDTDSAGGVSIACREFVPARMAKGIESADEGHECKYSCEQAPQCIAFDRFNLIAKKGQGQGNTVGNLPNSP